MRAKRGQARTCRSGNRSDRSIKPLIDAPIHLFLTWVGTPFYRHSSNLARRESSSVCKPTFPFASFWLCHLCRSLPSPWRNAVWTSNCSSSRSKLAVKAKSTLIELIFTTGETISSSLSSGRRSVYMIVCCISQCLWTSPSQRNLSTVN